MKLIWAGAALCSLFFAWPVAAETQLALSPCSTVRAAEVRRILRIELASDPVETNPTRVDVRCEQGTTWIHADMGERVMSRAIDLAATTVRARSRLLAISIAELVTAAPASPPTVSAAPESTAPAPPTGDQSSELAADKPVAEKLTADKAEPPPPIVEQLSSSATDLRPHSFTVALIMLIEDLGETGPLWGGGVRCAHAFTQSISLAVELALVKGTKHSTIGSVVVASTAGALNLFWQKDFHYVRTALGAGVRGGSVDLSGHPFTSQMTVGHSMNGAWLAPSLEAVLAIPIGRRLSAELLGETGYVILPVNGTVDGARTVVAVRDGIWAAAIGIGYSW